MSYDDYDAQQDALWEQASEALYPEHFERAVAEFTSDRLQSFYMAHRDVALAPLDALSKARALLPDHPEAALVFAAVAVEIGLRAAVLRPITYGLVHDEDIAGAVAEVLMTTRPPLDRLRELSLRILAAHGGIALESDRRPGATEALWPEMGWLQKERNKVLHLAIPVASESAEKAVAIAAHFLEVVFPKLLARLELNLGPDGLVSYDTGCRIPFERPYRLDGDGRVYGPCASGQYVFRDDGRLFEGSSDTGFYVSGGHLCGPRRSPPWVDARAELGAALDALNASNGPLEIAANLRRLSRVLFVSHALPYQPLEDGDPETVGMTVTPTGSFLVGGHLGLGLAPVAAIRAFEEEARRRDVGGVYFAPRWFESAAVSLEPMSNDRPVMLMDGEEIALISTGRLLLSDVLDQKFAAARGGRMYLPVRPRALPSLATAKNS